MGSFEARCWLVKNMPVNQNNVGDALMLLSHLSWKSFDRAHLAEHYLLGGPSPYSSPIAYECFAAVMPAPELLTVLFKCVPRDKQRIQLFKYVVSQALIKKYTQPVDRQLVNQFLEKLDERRL